MTSRVEAVSATSDVRIERYRSAESRLWEASGLQPRELAVALPGGGRIRVQELGSGDAVLWIHGTGGSGAYFAPLIAALPAGLRHLVVDRPGWGTSTMVDFASRSYAELVNEVCGAVLDHLRIERVHLVGASIGDLWALRFALAQPGRVGRVVLLGGGPISPAVEVPPFIRLLRSPIGNLIVRLPERPAIFRRQLAGMGHASSLAEGRVGDTFVKWHMALSRDTDWARNERTMVRGIVGAHGFNPGLVPAPDEVAGLQAPLLLVFGTHDPVGSVPTWKRFTASIPGATLDLVEGGGHLVWLDDPGRVAASVGRHLTAPA